MKDVYNVNVGVLGHVDSGKTSLVAALSDVLSVAALDKHPQSQERGITLDIGFSAFTVCISLTSAIGAPSTNTIRASTLSDRACPWRHFGAARLYATSASAHTQLVVAFPGLEPIAHACWYRVQSVATLCVMASNAAATLA